MWSVDRATAWWDRQPWLVGCNFIPSTAVNQLEMWQETTFDRNTIERELGWAAGLGFNVIRVYLHDLLWDQDQQGFKGRIDSFLDLTQQARIGVVFVIFDDVWNASPQLGPQSAPHPGRHNPDWVQSPGLQALEALPGRLGPSWAARALCPWAGLELQGRPPNPGLGRLQRTGRIPLAPFRAGGRCLSALASRCL
jgi:hypothetical protein